MKKMTSDELRESYLKFFESKGHKIIPSASLIPENDPSVLFTTAGMHPLVPYLLGQKHPAGKRLCDVALPYRLQPCGGILPAAAAVRPSRRTLLGCRRRGGIGGAL